MAASDSLHSEWTTTVFSSQADFQLTIALITYAPVIIWPIAYIALRYPRRCVCLPVSMDTPADSTATSWFVSKNCTSISAQTCLTTRFLETAYMSQYK
jgi:hypothetical protein